MYKTGETVLIIYGEINELGVCQNDSRVSDSLLFPSLNVTSLSDGEGYLFGSSTSIKKMTPEEIDNWKIMKL